MDTAIQILQANEANVIFINNLFFCLNNAFLINKNVIVSRESS